LDSTWAVATAQIDWPTWVESLTVDNLPDWLGWVARRNHGEVWLARVPAAIRTCVEAWGLELGSPMFGGSTALVLEARRADGSAAVLKVQYVDRECEYEAEALRIWKGNGAARLLEFNPIHHALLIERCRPGVHLHEWDVPITTVLDTLAELARKLCVPAGIPFGTLEEEAAFWISRLEGLRYERLWESRLSDAAIDALRCVGPTQGEQVLLDMDLTVRNVLSSQRCPWLVVDPKPVVGEREFMAAPIVRAHELGHSRRQTLYRLDRMTADLGLDRERSRLWCIGQTLAWARWSPQMEAQLDTVRWLVDS
jgi:streptomycin 6-kinase